MVDFKAIIWGPYIYIFLKPWIKISCLDHVRTKAESGKIVLLGYFYTGVF